MRKQYVHSSRNMYRVGVQCLPDLDPWICIGLALLDTEPDPVAMKLTQMSNKPDP
jgi:hypothetical protein